MGGRSGDTCQPDFRHLFMHPTQPTDAIRVALTQAYAAARRLVGPHTNLVVLHIGPEQSGVGFGAGPEMSVPHVMSIGFERTAREHFRTEPPTALAMENAIVTVEDAVMPLRAVLPREARLFTQDTALREIAKVAGTKGDAALSLEAMERCFDNLSAVVMGAQAARLGLPASNEFAANLLILREFMHHLQFAQMEWVAT